MKHPHLAAKTQPKSQKLLWRIRPLRTIEIFHSKIRRTEGERRGVALPPANLVLCCAPNGAASNQTF
jgi:hypothetical protein